MSDQKPSAQNRAKQKPLKSKIGLQLEVLGSGEPIGPQKTETVRVKRLGDGGVRDLPRAELEQVNGKEAVAAALDRVTPPTPPPSVPSETADSAPQQ